MMTGARKQVVHTCGLCEAIFEGPSPPKTCPRCGVSVWKKHEVGGRPGVVGATEFVPGTETPMTRVFYCKVCRTMNVTRDGSIPVTCTSCRHEAKADHELFDESTPGKKIAVDDTPISQPAQAPTPRDLPPAQAGQPGVHDLPLPQRIQRTQFADMLPEETGISGRMIVPGGGHGGGAPVQPPDEYRSEWVAERVVAMLDSASLGTTLPDDAWAYVESFYDAGRARGHLP